jgi:integrase
MIKYKILKRENKTTGWSSKTYYVRFYDNGKLSYINTDQTSKKAADIKAREIISKIPIKVKVSEASVRHLSLKQYLINNEWLSNTENPLYKDFKSGLSQHSFQLRASSLKVRYLNKIFMELNDPLGEVLYFNISKDDIRKFKESLLTYEMTNNIRNTIIYSLSSVYSYLIKNDKYIKSNPFTTSQIEMFKVVDKKKYVFAPYQVYYLFNLDLLEKIEPVNTTQMKWDNLLESDYFKAFKFAAYTGMRKSEITALTVGQIEDRVVHINRAFKDTAGKITGLPKNGKARDIVLCDEVYEIIADNIKDKRSSDFVFKNRKGLSIHGNYSTSWTRFKEEIFEAFDIKMNTEKYRFSPHGLRKSLNTNLLKFTDSNIKESYIRFYCGWSDAINTLTAVQEEHYTGYGVDQLTKIANEIQKIYVSDVINEVIHPKKETNPSWKPSKEEIEKLDFLLKVENIYGDKLINLILLNFTETPTYYNEKLTTEELSELDKLDDQIRYNLTRVNEIKFKQLLIRIKNELVNIMAIKKLTGKPSEYKKFYDNCDYLLNKVKAEEDLFTPKEYEGVLTNPILENEIKDKKIQVLSKEIFKDFVDADKIGNLLHRL